MQRMLECRRGRYPADLPTFASCHESYSEARNVDATYLGRRVEDLDVPAVLRCVDTAFMAGRPLAYYWPRILEAMRSAPGSQFSETVVDLVFSRWTRDDGRADLRFDLLSPADWEDTLSVLREIASPDGKPRTLRRIRAMISWIESSLRR